MYSSFICFCFLMYFIILDLFDFIMFNFLCNIRDYWFVVYVVFNVSGIDYGDAR